MYGANLNLDADGNVESIFDGRAPSMYLLLPRPRADRPNVLVG